MIIASVTVKTPVEVIDIDSGITYPLSVGDHSLIVKPTATWNYLLLTDSKYGAVQRWWEDQEKAGNLVLHREAEDNDPRYDGTIKLPIKSGNDLTIHQKINVRCGLLIAGKFYCERCALQKNLLYPNAIPIYPINILPFSQSCYGCSLQIFDIWREKNGGPKNLFT